MQSQARFTSLLALAATTVLVLACGIGFGDEEVETELFKSIEVGPAVAGEPTTITLEYARQYPVALEVKCDLLSVADIPSPTPLATATISPAERIRTPEPTEPPIPRVRPTPKNKVMEIFGMTLEANDEGGPVGEATPILGVEERRFFAPAAGDYTVWCYTPADQNNSIFEPLTVSPQ
jgi:hypothetical protein